MKYSDEVVEKIGDSVDVKFVSNIKDEYNIGYKDKNGELQWFTITPKEETKFFDTKTGNMKIVLDETRRKNELVREKNKFITQKPILFGQETKKYYPMYTLYITDKENIADTSHTK